MIQIQGVLGGALRGTCRRAGDAGCDRVGRRIRTMSRTTTAGDLRQGFLIQFDVTDTIQRTELKIDVGSRGCRQRRAGFDEVNVHASRKAEAVVRECSGWIREQRVLERRISIGEGHDLADDLGCLGRCERHMSSRWNYGKPRACTALDESVLI